MHSTISKAILMTLVVTNFASADSKIGMPLTARKVEIKPSSANSADAIKFEKLPVILDNSKFDLKQLLKPDIKDSTRTKVFGPGSGGGGNICGLAIQRVTADLLRYFQEVPAGKAPSYREALYEGISQVKFLAGSDLMLRGQSVNAINYSEQKIIVLDQVACDLLQKGDKQGKMFLLHEYLGLANVEDENYQISTNLVEDLVRIRASEKKSNIFQIIPQTTVGPYALAWGMVGNPLDIDRYAWDEDYRTWVQQQFLVAYLVDHEDGKVLSIIYQDQSFPVTGPRWDASLISDGKSGLLVLQSDRWETRLAAAFLADKKNGTINKVSDATMLKLNQDLSTAGTRLASASHAKDIKNMAMSISSYDVKVVDGVISLPVSYYHPKSVDGYSLDIRLDLRFDYSNRSANKELQIVKAVKVREDLPGRN